MARNVENGRVVASDVSVDVRDSRNSGFPPGSESVNGGLEPTAVCDHRIGATEIGRELSASSVEEVLRHVAELDPTTSAVDDHARERRCAIYLLHLIDLDTLGRKSKQHPVTDLALAHTTHERCTTTQAGNRDRGVGRSSAVDLKRIGRLVPSAHRAQLIDPQHAIRRRESHAHDAW